MVSCGLRDVSGVSQHVFESQGARVLRVHFIFDLEEVLILSRPDFLLVDDGELKNDYHTFRSCL